MEWVWPQGCVTWDGVAVTTPLPPHHVVVVMGEILARPGDGQQGVMCVCNSVCVRV